MSKGSIITLLGLAMLLLCLVPVASAEEVINTAFTVNPGGTYGPYDPGTTYHTRVLSTSMLKGEVNVEGEGIYFTANFYNTQHLNNIYVEGRHRFTVDPADDLYVFTFDNTEGRSDCFIQFRLEEIWTSPLVLSSPIGFVSGGIGFVVFVSGVIVLVRNRFYIRLLIGVLLMVVASLIFWIAQFIYSLFLGMVGTSIFIIGIYAITREKKAERGA